MINITGYVPFTPIYNSDGLPFLSYRVCWHRILTGLIKLRSSFNNFIWKIPQSRLLVHTLVHWPIFFTAAHRLMLWTFSFPMSSLRLWSNFTSRRLVKHYLTNYLLGVERISRRGYPFHYIHDSHRPWGTFPMILTSTPCSLIVFIRLACVKYLDTHPDVP